MVTRYCSQHSVAGCWWRKTQVVPLGTLLLVAPPLSKSALFAPLLLLYLMIIVYLVNYCYFCAAVFLLWSAAVLCGSKLLPLSWTGLLFWLSLSPEVLVAVGLFYLSGALFGFWDASLSKQAETSNQPQRTSVHQLASTNCIHQLASRNQQLASMNQHLSTSVNGVASINCLQGTRNSCLYRHIVSRSFVY